MLNFLTVRAQLVLVTVIFASALFVAGFYAYETVELLRVGGPIEKSITEGNYVVADVLPPPKYAIDPYYAVFRSLGATVLGPETDPGDRSDYNTLNYWKRYFDNLIDGAGGYMDRHRLWIGDARNQELKAEEDPRITPYLERIQNLLDEDRKDFPVRRAEEITKWRYQNQFVPYMDKIYKERAIKIDRDLNKKLRTALIADSFAHAEEFIRVYRGEIYPAMANYCRTKDVKYLEEARGKAYGKLAATFEKHLGDIEVVVALAAARGDAFAWYAEDTKNSTYRNLGIGAGAVFLLLLLMVGSIRRAFGETKTLSNRVEEQRKVLAAENQALQRNVKELLLVVADAAEGDLTVRAKVAEGTLGNVADAFNFMMDTWAGLMTNIREQSAKTDAAISQIREATVKMAGGATQQVQEIGQASDAVQRMSKDIEKVSQNAETAVAAARRTQESALAGSESVQNVIRGMESLRLNVQAGAKKIKNLGDRSMEITGIVATIAKISDQTNMLALNAAIEAARAGEHGRGFNVVADEVRQLAERTANATQEIEKLVKTIQAETNESVAAIEQQTQVVEEEAQVVGQAGDALVKIQEVSTQSAELIADISSTARQQVAGTQDVVRVMERVSDIARQTQASADISARLTQDLSELSAQVVQAVSRFKTSTNGEASPGEAAS